MKYVSKHRESKNELLPLELCENSFSFCQTFRWLAAAAPCADVAQTYRIHRDPEHEDK